MDAITPTIKDENRYAVLMETSGKEYESWLTFIKVEGNEDNLKLLQAQFELIEWYILGENSTFDLDLENTVSDITAREMTTVDLNHSLFHRKYDGVLQPINFGLDKVTKNKKKIKLVNELLGFGGIEDYVDGEDVVETEARRLAMSSSDSDDDDDTDGSTVATEDDDVSLPSEGEETKEQYTIPSKVEDAPRVVASKAKSNTRKR